MSGGVWERTSDWYDSQYYSESPSADPHVTPNIGFRLCRVARR